MAWDNETENGHLRVSRRLFVGGHEAREFLEPHPDRASPSFYRGGVYGSRDAQKCRQGLRTFRAGLRVQPGLRIVEGR